MEESIYFQAEQNEINVLLILDKKTIICSLLISEILTRVFVLCYFVFQNKPSFPTDPHFLGPLVTAPPDRLIE